MKRTPLNRYSEKRIIELQEEMPIRIALCKRAGGTPVTREVTVYRSGKSYTYTKVECVGGRCECGLPSCARVPQYGERLEPHEVRHRAVGGKLSLENTRMVLRRCHRILQHSEPIWSVTNAHANP